MHKMYGGGKIIWWDNVKLDIKNASIQYCEILRKVKHMKEMTIRKELEKEKE